MALIEMRHVHLTYPLRVQAGLTFKEFFLQRLWSRNKVEVIREIQALRDVSLRVVDGERVGIIGFNGAGKTTLLRTMAGIYPIAAGERCVEGSICSLLDIGVGMETDATGWANIRYRSFLQGETPRSIKSKIQGIADFTELGSFLNLPIRCYSSGMSMRLAFAIATSSEPEILFIDEVFAAGDLAFQKKAEDRMRKFMRQAKILVMVGHSLAFFQDFCERVIWLDQGSIRMDGPAASVIGAYKQAAEAHHAAAA